ncbi:MAG: hypothetical protein AB7G12_12820 [Thermoanaerobaculia bacterium]
MKLERVTACECASAGYCPRHRCRKTDRLVELCATRPQMFAQWEAGKGPCIHAPEEVPVAEQIPARGLGDVVARTLRLARVDRLAKRALNLVRGRRAEADCGCAGRQQALNDSVTFHKK